jgi:hypothetical protein
MKAATPRPFWVALQQRMNLNRLDEQTAKAA